MDFLVKKYQPINEELVLFNEEHYLSVIIVHIADLETSKREALFNHLFEFASNDVDLEIDVSEEHNGIWYLQVLVPHVLTLPDVAAKRIGRGKEQLEEHLASQPVQLIQNLLSGEEIYTYVKRYNPNIEVVS
ncbi:hypothetical protein [Brevibacillus reuszeri]|uniref:hypothetical protein n=1 Tax=Brevibacillus reuszeri TaxID=54915 RepID=UPI002897769F|nr:hypothetical protein [Brevibacillus reuszeri]